MKKTANQIREEVKRQMANKNKEELERARERVKAVWEQYRDAEERAKKYKAENETLKEKLVQLDEDLEIMAMAMELQLMVR